MKFKIRKASDYRYKDKKEFTTLEELIDFKNSCGSSLIICKDFDGSLALEIYDEYRE